jgi:hypothetical protein
MLAHDDQPDGSRQTHRFGQTRTCVTVDGFVPCFRFDMDHKRRAGLHDVGIAFCTQGNSR